MKRRHEKPFARVNPSGERVWVARPTDRHGTRHYIGTRKLKREAQALIDAFYDAEDQATGGASVTVGEYAASWLKKHPRTDRTNSSYNGRVGYVLDVKVEQVKFRDWPIGEVRRRHATDLLDHMLREQGRAASGAQGVLRVLSAMWQDALSDDRADMNPFMGVKVRQGDPRVQKAPRRIRVWSWEQMHEFAAAAGVWEPMVRTISDCWLRIGEVFPLERPDLMTGQCAHEDCEIDVPHFHVERTAWRGKVTTGTKEDRLREARGGSPWSVGRAVPVAPALLTLLQSAPRRIDTRLWFPSPRGVVWGDRRWYDEVWYPARKVTGIDPTPHEFRHSAISHMRAAGLDPADLAAMSGHTLETATRHYTHALGRSFAAAREAVGE